MGASSRDFKEDWNTYRSTTEVVADRVGTDASDVCVLALAIATGSSSPDGDKYRNLFDQFGRQFGPHFVPPNNFLHVQSSNGVSPGPIQVSILRS